MLTAARNAAAITLSALLTVSILAPTAHADAPPVPAPPASTGATVPEPPVVAPTPTVSPSDPVAETVRINRIHDQLAYLGYPVTGKELDEPSLGKNTKKSVKKFQLKFGLKVSGKLDGKTTKALNKYAGDAIVPKRCKTGQFTLCVNKYNKTLTIVSEKGAILKVIDARYGRPGLETAEGRFSVTRKGGLHHISTMYGVDMPMPVYFHGGQAIHYSYEYARYPNTLSHGCVGTRDWDTQHWLWTKAHVGTPVIVYNEKPATKKH